LIPETRHLHSRKLSVDQHREDAPTQAAERVDQLLYEGDIEGALVWRAIVRAIEELQRERGPGEAVD
jgi:hypothetical protein